MLRVNTCDIQDVDKTRARDTHEKKGIPKFSKMGIAWGNGKNMSKFEPNIGLCSIIPMITQNKHICGNLNFFHVIQM